MKSRLKAVFPLIRGFYLLVAMVTNVIQKRSMLVCVWGKIAHSLVHGKLSFFNYWARVLLHSAHKPSLASLAQGDLKLLKQIKQESIAVTSLDNLNLNISKDFESSIEELLSKLPSFTEPSTEGDALNGRSTQLHCCSIDPPELIKNYKSIFLFGLDQRLLDIMEHLIGVPPALTSVHFRIDIGNRKQVGTRIWHVDTEDRRVIRVIVYLSDVTINDGPFEYIPKKLNINLRQLFERGKRAAGDPILDSEMKQYVPEHQWAQCIGPKGTIVFADNAALFHHGKPHASERLALIYTYTTRHPRYPAIELNPALDNVLSSKQRASFYVKTEK